MCICITESCAVIRYEPGHRVVARRYVVWVATGYMEIVLFTFTSEDIELVVV